MLTYKKENIMWMKHSKLNEHEQKLKDMSVEEFDHYMMEHYPDMFKKRNRPPDQKFIEPMNFGFEIGNGWRHVLDSLCKKVKVLQDTFGFILVFDQVKEKIGSARFYTHIEFPESTKVSKEQAVAAEIAKLIADHYEEYTDYVCEELGTNINPNEKISLGSWYYGMGLEGYIQSTEKSRLDEKEKKEKIEIAKKSDENRKNISDLKRKLNYLKKEDIEEINSLVDEKIKNKT